MNFTGTVKDGVVILPPDAKLPEGAQVQVFQISDDPFVQAALELAKPRPAWPADFAQNHGHYLFGEPRRD